MQEVLIVRPDATPDEIAQAFIHSRINVPLGVIVTRPKDIDLAQQFGCDIMTMFNDAENARLAAKQISEQSDSLVIVIGEPC